MGTQPICGKQYSGCIGQVHHEFHLMKSKSIYSVCYVVFWVLLETVHFFGTEKHYKFIRGWISYVPHSMSAWRVKSEFFKGTNSCCHQVGHSTAVSSVYDLSILCGHVVYFHSMTKQLLQRQSENSI